MIPTFLLLLRSVRQIYVTVVEDKLLLLLLIIYIIYLLDVTLTKIFAVSVYSNLIFLPPELCIVF